MADLDDRLDELIPPTAGPFKTLAVSATLVGAAIAFTVLTIGGYVYPRPTFGSSFSSGSFLEVDQARAAVSATVVMPNNGSRSVRITDIALDGPGADVVEVGAFVGSAPVEPLPVVVPAGQMATIVVWFRPTECVDRSGPWGIVDATVDFGDGAFPPFSNTVRLVQDPVADVDLDATPDNGGELMMLRGVDGSFTTVGGPLAGACEALR